MISLIIILYQQHTIKLLHVVFLSIYLNYTVPYELHGERDIMGRKAHRECE